jgi:hypothetical protein
MVGYGRWVASGGKGFRLQASGKKSQQQLLCSSDWLILERVEGYGSRVERKGKYGFGIKSLNRILTGML